MQDHEFFISRCLHLAALGVGNVSPNPMVGCVIVAADGKTVLSEGWHQQYGGPHAEVNAVNKITDPKLLDGATVYVSLEPCAHYGKTPPCADMLAALPIGRVVIAMVDPFAAVSGKGIEKLKSAGKEVIVGVMEQAAKELNKRFLTRVEMNRPYIILKWAQSTDGYISAEEGAPSAISCYESNVKVHQMRSVEDAVLIGATTAITDNPQLTVRHVVGRNPVRVLIDPDMSVPANSHIFNNEAATIVFNRHEEGAKGSNKYFIPNFKTKDFGVSEMMQTLAAEGISSVIIEGGAQTHLRFLESGLWDECLVIVAPKLLYTGVKAAAIPQGKYEAEKIGSDTWFTIFNNL